MGDRRVILSSRIGIIVNQQNDCFTHNSIIGFGTGGYNSCGNEATLEPDNGDKHTRATGYINSNLSHEAEIRKKKWYTNLNKVMKQWDQTCRLV